MSGEACPFEELREGVPMGYEDPGTEHDEERHYRARKRACQQARTSHLRRI